MNTFYKFIFLFLGFLLSNFSFANKLTINNVSRPANDVIQFDISWENSWYLNYAPNNWDAVWVFVKAQDCNTDQKAWEHVDVSTSPSDHSANNPILQIDTVADGKGVFVRRATIGAGTIPTTTVTIKLQNSYNPSNVNFEVLGIEMVAVLDGNFQIGGTSGSYASSAAGNAFANGHVISSENAIAAGAIRTSGMSSSSVYYSQFGYNPAIPADFPKGYNKYYIMKYEISQEQYVRFLNLLNFHQQGSRTQNSPGNPVGSNAMSSNISGIVRRNAVKIRATGTVNSPTVYGSDMNENGNFDETDDGQNIACNFLNWHDLLAYLDWAALRPMTEFEYEKACRGNDAIVTDEYAWGNPNITSANANNLLHPQEPNEISSLPIGSNSGVAAYAYTSSAGGPLRVGFAATQSTIRMTAGASYWGVLDLTGNVWEQTVSAGYANGNISAFTGVLGDGEIDGGGNANQNDWNMDPIFSVVRGGSFYTTTSSSQNYGKVGSRNFLGSTSYNSSSSRHYETGGRGVRQF